MMDGLTIGALQSSDVICFTLTCMILGFSILCTSNQHVFTTARGRNPPRTPN